MSRMFQVMANDHDIDKYGMKIYGPFGSFPDALEKAKKLQERKDRTGDHVTVYIQAQELVTRTIFEKVDQERYYLNGEEINKDLLFP